MYELYARISYEMHTRGSLAEYTYDVGASIPPRKRSFRRPRPTGLRTQRSGSSISAGSSRSMRSRGRCCSVDPKKKKIRTQRTRRSNAEDPKVDKKKSRKGESHIHTSQQEHPRKCPHSHGFEEHPTIHRSKERSKHGNIQRTNGPDAKTCRDRRGEPDERGRARDIRRVSGKRSKNSSEQNQRQQQRTTSGMQ